MPGRVFINEMNANQLVEGIFTMQNCQLGLTKGGKPYLKCLLVDRTGRSPGRMWNCSEDFVQSLPTDGFVYIEGQTQPYQGEMQIIIQTMRAAKPRPEDLTDLLPCTDRNIDEMFAEVHRLLGTVRSRQVRALIDEYVNDQELMSRFRQAPAAMTLHHAYLGGLLEHTLTLMRLADATLPFYPQLNRDIVLMGLFLHDMAKCEELVWQTGFNYSDDGQLVGHIARGILWLENKARQAAQNGTFISPELLRVLHHIIISHHGQPEFGALKLPATPEAIFIHQIDNVDAKTHMAIAACKESGRADELGSTFSEKIWALGTRIYRGNPLADEGPSPREIAAAATQPAAPQPLPAPQRAKPTDGPPVAALNIGGARPERKGAPQGPTRGGL